MKSVCWKEMWQPILLKNRKYLKLRKKNKKNKKKIKDACLMENGRNWFIKIGFI